MLYWGKVTNNSAMVTGLREKGVPVRVMKDENIEDVATASEDLVWVTDGRSFRGLERKVVICVRPPVDVSDRLHSMSRCTSQLVIVSAYC